MFYEPVELCRYCSSPIKRPQTPRAFRNERRSELEASFRAISVGLVIVLVFVLCLRRVHASTKSSRGGTSIFVHCGSVTCTAVFSSRSASYIFFEYTRNDRQTSSINAAASWHGSFSACRRPPSLPPSLPRFTSQVLERFGVPLEDGGRRLIVTRTVGGKGSSASVNGYSVKVRYVLRKEQSHSDKLNLNNRQLCRRAFSLSLLSLGSLLLQAGMERTDLLVLHLLNLLCFERLHVCRRGFRLALPAARFLPLCMGAARCSTPLF